MILLWFLIGSPAWARFPYLTHCQIGIENDPLLFSVFREKFKPIPFCSKNIRSRKSSLDSCREVLPVQKEFFKIVKQLEPEDLFSFLLERKNNQCDTGSLDLVPVIDTALNGLVLNSSMRCRNFATPSMALFLEYLGQKMSQIFPNLEFRIGDISSPQGGRLRGHKSHAFGEDVDIPLLKAFKGWGLQKINRNVRDSFQSDSEFMGSLAHQNQNRWNEGSDRKLKYKSEAFAARTEKDFRNQFKSWSLLEINARFLLEVFKNPMVCIRVVFSNRNLIKSLLKIEPKLRSFQEKLKNYPGHRTHFHIRIDSHCLPNQTEF